MPRIRVAAVPLSQANAPQTVVVSGSPFVYTATRSSLAIVTGGVVTLIELSIAGAAYISVGVLSGQFVLPLGSSLRITAPLTAPTLTIVPL